jgi:hypothetical protein
MERQAELIPADGELRGAAMHGRVALTVPGVMQ